ncbi:Gfo/Idh/MocA family protein [Niabella aquatica]
MKSRRKFLQQVTIASAGLPLLGSGIFSFKRKAFHSFNSDKVLRVALMGLGGYARRVAEAMNHCRRAKVTGLISGTPEKLKSWGAAYHVPEKNCYNYQNFDSIRNNPDIDAVYVTTPNALHCNNTVRAARAGKHVICEKPMAISVKEGHEMMDACKKANVHLLVGYRMHFEPTTLEVVRMRNEGELGAIRFFQGLCGFRIGDPSQWRLNMALAGGGSLMDIGIYAINGCRYMVGEEPVWVTAQETKTDTEKFRLGVDETIQFQFGFKSGAVASCLSSYNMNNLDRFFLNGEKGFAEMQPSTGYGPIKGRTNKGEINAPVVVHQTVQMDEMAAIILDGKQPVIPVDGEEGLRDLKIIEAIYKAVSMGKKIGL